MPSSSMSLTSTTGPGCVSTLGSCLTVLSNMSMAFTEDYPGKPPKVKFFHVDGKVLFHPNVYPSGTVCLSILNEDEDWKPSITIRQILVGIQDLLDNPNEKSPAQHDSFVLFTQNKEEYTKKIKEQTMRVVNGGQGDPN